MKQYDPVGDAVTDLLDGLHGKKPIREATIAGEQELTNEQRSRLPYVMALYYPCCLCEAEPPPGGMFTWKLGKETIITPVCVDCIRLVGCKDLIRERLGQWRTQ